jgi:hypothetical protein
MAAGTASAGAAVGMLIQGSSIGQLFGPPFVVGVGAAVGSWTGRPAALTCMAVLIVGGGLLYRRLDHPVRPVPVSGRASP